MSKRNYCDDCETGGPEEKWTEYYSVRQKSHMHSPGCVYFRHTYNCTKLNMCSNFRQAVRSWLPDLVQHRARQRTAWRILCHFPHRGQNARCSLLLSATVLLWEGHSCSHLTEIHASQKKRNSLLRPIMPQCDARAWRRAYMDYLITRNDSISAQRQIML